MCTYSLSHLSDHTLLHDLAALVARDRSTTAELLAHVAEVDARRLYLRAAYPSMYAYCVGELSLSEEAAFKRIHAARAARRFPGIFAALAEGRLHLSAVVMLAPRLTPESADEVLAASEHKSKSELERLLAERFPRPDVPTRIHELSPSPMLGAEQASPGIEPALEPVDQHAPGRVDPPVPRPRLAPLAPERFALQVTIGQGTHDKLRHAQALLGHQLPSGDVAEVLDRALDALIRDLERRKFAATSRPRDNRQHSTADGRYVPALVRRAVWQRDSGQCTFVSEAGRRCRERKLLEFDHVQEVARGGGATIGGIRLRCRAHNQYGAERTYGAEFMARKRRQAQRAVTAAGPHGAAAADRDVSPWLRRLGFNVQEARRAAAHCESIPDASLEDRVRVALSFLAVRPRYSSRDRIPVLPRTQTAANMTPTTSPVASCLDQPLLTSDQMP